VKALLPTIAFGTFLTSPAFCENAVSVTQNLADQWGKAYTAQNADALTALYTKDAILLPPGTERPLSGEGAIHQYFEELVKQAPMKNFAAKAIEGRMSGSDAGFAAGTFGGDVLSPAAGASSHATGTFLCVVVRKGADWKFQSDAWNLLPATQPQKEAAKQ
jgi:ketosteroid isomerase-like protein